MKFFPKKCSNIPFRRTFSRKQIFVGALSGEMNLDGALMLEKNLDFALFVTQKLVL